MTRYLLSSGESTTKIEEYILDLFNIYLTVYPGDIPHRRDLGFNFLLTDVTKDTLKESVRTKVTSLIEKISGLIPGNIKISISSLDLIDEEIVKLVIDVSGVKSDDIYINLYQE